MSIFLEPRTIALQDARSNFSDIVGKAMYADEPTIITKSGKNAAVVISFKDYKRYRQLEDQLDGDLATERLAENNQRFSTDEVKAKLGL